MAMQPATRRDFIYSLSLAFGSSLLAPLSSCSLPQGKSQNSGSAQAKKLGIALVGLGSYSTHQLAPALQLTKHCYLAGIVTGTPSKEKQWADKYNIPPGNIYNYQNFDAIANNKDI